MPVSVFKCKYKSSIDEANLVFLLSVKDKKISFIVTLHVAAVRRVVVLLIVSSTDALGDSCNHQV